MEEISRDIVDNRNTSVGTAYRNTESYRKQSLNKPKQENKRGDMDEVYTSAGVR
jgi:hypothetical protein